jgi:hypothetical protein
MAQTETGDNVIEMTIGRVYNVPRKFFWREAKGRTKMFRCRLIEINDRPDPLARTGVTREYVFLRLLMNDRVTIRTTHGIEA